MIFGFWTLVVVLAAGIVGGTLPNSLRAFGASSPPAASCGFFGLFFFLRMKFPPQVMTRQQTTRPDSRTTSPCSAAATTSGCVAFIGCWGLALNIGMPFYSVFVSCANSPSPSAT
jgi:hypothetical protein